MIGIIRKMFIRLLTGLVSVSNHTKCTLMCALLIYIVINTVKNSAFIHLQLNEANVLEVVILLMTYLIKFVFQIKQKI